MHTANLKHITELLQTALDTAGHLYSQDIMPVCCRLLAAVELNEDTKGKLLKASDELAASDAVLNPVLLHMNIPIITASDAAKVVFPAYSQSLRNLQLSSITGLSEEEKFTINRFFDILTKPVRAEKEYRDAYFMTDFTKQAAESMNTCQKLLDSLNALNSNIFTIALNGDTITQTGSGEIIIIHKGEIVFRAMASREYTVQKLLEIYSLYTGVIEPYFNS